MAELKGTYTVAELANKYKCNIKTFRNVWLKKVKGLHLAKRQRLLMPIQVQRILEHLGEW